MQFLADMGVSRRVASWLREGGHNVVHLTDERLHRLPDVEIFAKAVAEGRIVLTFDLDFGEIVSQSKGQSVGVVLFRLNNATSSNVIRRLHRVLNDADEALGNGAIVVVEDSRHRVRRTPIGRE